MGRGGEEGLGGHPAQCSLTANPPQILVNGLKHFGNPCSIISGDIVESFPFFFLLKPFLSCYPLQPGFVPKRFACLEA